MADPLKLSELGIGLNAGDVLCSFDDFGENGALEFSYRCGSEMHDIFLQKKGDAVYAFVNICPHAGTPLNMEEGKFMEKTGNYLMCHTHGALFQLYDGLCVAGPCNGHYLKPVGIIIEGTHVLVV